MAARSALTDHISLTYDDPHWYTDATHFRSALEHYLTTYGTPDLPPSWLMTESLTIGSLERVIANLRRRADQTAIASSLGINAALLKSWLRTYVRVRNICAHRGRLWNVGLGVYPAIPTAASVPWLTGTADLDDREAKRLYPVLASMQSILLTISPRSRWSQRLEDLIGAHPGVPIRAMGFPTTWHNDPFWTVTPT